MSFSRRVHIPARALCFAALAILSPVVVNAQVQKAPPRAVPVEDPPATPKPPLPKAVPVGPNGGVPPRAVPVTDDPPVVPATPAAKGPEQDLFDYAMLAFTQKDYAIAAQSFGKYLQAYPQGKEVPWALFRLGECYRFQGNTTEYERVYREVVEHYPKSDAVPNAAYWLAASAYNTGDFKTAAMYFGVCQAKAKVDAVKLAAAFYQSEAYGALKDRKKQLEALKAVLAVKKGNDFLEKALLSSATILQQEGKNKEALPMLMELFDTSEDPKVRGDSALKAAIIQGELKQSDEAIGLYDKVLKTRDAAPEQQGAALVGIISELSAKSAWDQITDTYNRNASLLPPPELRPRMLMQVANAHRAKKSYARAIDFYNMILQFSAGHELAFEAGYWQVYCYYMLEDRHLADFARKFVKDFEPSHKGHEYINKARLLVADNFFNHQDYKSASAEYGQIVIANLPAGLRASTWYHKGWSEAETAQHGEAINSLTEYINLAATDPDLPKALAKRGLSYKENNENDKALEDFQRIIKDYPKDEAVELAYYLSGLVHMAKGSTQLMIDDFLELEKRFPSSPARPEALYRAGVGYLELKDKAWMKALPLLRKAVEADKKTFGKAASEKIQLCLWAKKDMDALAVEVDAYRSTYRDAILQHNMMAVLGISFFDRKDFIRAERYMNLATSGEPKEDIKPYFWNILAQASLELKHYEQSVKAVEQFLATDLDPKSKADALLVHSRGLLGTGKWDDAIAAADAGLQIVKGGVEQGQLLIVQGDALIAQGDKLETEGNHDGAAEKWKAAASKFIVPSQVTADPLVTPEALTKAAAALERTGDKPQAEKMRAQLKKDYPDYRAD